MKINLLNKNKIKIMFDYKELEENNISVHSFLSTPLEKQSFFTAILDIAREDFGFEYTSFPIFYEIISFNNKYFIVFVKKTTEDQNLIHNSEYSSTYTKTLFFKFNDLDTVFSFCNNLKILFPELKFDSNLYKYENNFFLKVDLKKFSTELQNKISLIISEFEDKIILSKLSMIKFEEFADILIENNAISVLSILSRYN